MKVETTRKSKVPERHFTIAPRGVVWALTEYFRGYPISARLVATEAEANRIRQQLSDEHVVGFVVGGRS